jgi:hypothetical protein
MDSRFKILILISLGLNTFQTNITVPIDTDTPIQVHKKPRLVVEAHGILFKHIQNLFNNITLNLILIKQR